MREVLVEFSMMLPSQEHIDIYERLAEDGVLDKYFEKLFLQACSAAKAPEGKPDNEDINVIKEQLDNLTKIITNLTKNGVSVSVPAPSQENSTETAPPVQAPPKPKVAPKKRKSAGLGKGNSNFMAGIKAKSDAINKLRRDT